MGCLKFCVALSGAFLGVASAMAQPIGYSIADTRLIRLELESGTPVELGNLAGASRFVGATFGADGAIYAVGDVTDQLWRIDVEAVAASPVGPTGIDVQEDTGLAEDACGALWMVTNRRLYTLDRATGAATLVHDLGREVYALTADGTMLLGLVTDGFPNRLARIDSASGSIEVFGGEAPFPTLQQGLDFDEEGRLWGTFDNNSPIPEPWVSSLVEFEPTSGAILRVIPVDFLPSVLGGNFAASHPRGSCLAGVEVPLGGDGAKAALIALLAAAGCFFLSSKR